MSEPAQQSAADDVPDELPRRLMVCSFCSGDLGEIKTMGALGPCACCGIEENLCGPVSVDELQAMRERLERLAAIGAGMEEVARQTNRQTFGAVAGIIKTPGIDDALDAIESEADVVKENVNLLEGAQQSRAELERWNALYRETLTQCNKRLMPQGVVLGGCAPNPAGLGAVFAGIDHDKRDYLVTLSLPAKERNDFANASKEDFVRWAIDTICGAVLEQRAIYLRRAGLGSKGSN